MFGFQQLQPVDAQQRGVSPVPHVGGFVEQTPELAEAELTCADDGMSEDLLDDPHGHESEKEKFGSMYPASGLATIEIVCDPFVTSVGPRVLYFCGLAKQSMSFVPFTLQLMVPGKPPAFEIAIVAPAM